MPKKQKLTGRGGPGRGQGKKPGIMGVKGTRSMGFSPDILKYLKTLKSASAEVESLIRKSPAFKSWQKQSKKKPT